jgi:uncharacterized protein (DUF952 family)
MIYHLCRAEDWRVAGETGMYHGSAQDRTDGFLHFSTGAQVMESAARHRAGQAGLVLLTVDPMALGESLKWEASRGGALFPHLYGVLPVIAVHAVTDLPLDSKGVHVFPPLEE